LQALGDLESWCGNARDAQRPVGRGTAERLDVIPAHFQVVLTHRPKYACRACEQAVVQVPAPERLIFADVLKSGMNLGSIIAGVYRQSDRRPPAKRCGLKSQHLSTYTKGLRGSRSR
jgi:hypothetical protein